MVTVARFNDEAVGSSSNAEYYLIADEPIDYEVEWGAGRIASNMTSMRLAKLRDKYCIPHTIEMLVLKAHKRIYFSRPKCMAVSE